MNEQYIEDLYCIQDMVMKTVAEYAQKVKKAGKISDETSLKWGDTLMHFAKNLSKEICFAEGMNEEEAERFSGYHGGTQTYGRAIRTTPGIQYEGEGQSMRGGESYRGSYDGSYNRGYSTRRDSRGRYTSRGMSGNDDQEGTIAKLRRFADMTTNHDEREIMLNMIERLKNEG